MNLPPPSAFELDTLLKNVPGYIAVIDADLKLTTVYGTQGQIVRSLLETTGTRHWPELFALEVRPHVEQALQQAIATGAATTFEACLMPTAGDSIWFEHQVKPQSASGTVTSLIIAATDITSRKQLERQRQEQQRFIDGVLNTVQGWVVVYDHRAQKMVFANRNMIDFHGLPLGETEYHTYLTRETIHPDDYERVVDHGTRELINLKDGEVASIEFRGLAADGTWRWIDVRDSVLKRHSDGTVWQTLGVAIDVTEHKLAEARLLDIERRYQAIFEQSNDAILISAYGGDDINQIEPLALNPKAIKLLGYSVEETRDLDIPSIAVIAPEDEDEARRNLEQVVSGQQLPIYERTVVSKSGQHTPVEVNMVTVRAEDGRPQYGIAIARDISERKRHEQALEQSERFARSTVDALSAHIAILDENGTIVAVNRAWREFAEKNGAKSNVCEGANYLAVCDSAARIGSSEARDFAAGIRAVIQGESTVFAMEYACHAPRERRWFVGRVTRFPGGSPTRVVVAHENITQGKQQEEALAKAIEQAQVANEAKSIFLAHMSHELRTPLNAILGHAQLLAMEDNLMAQTHQRINVIENSGQHLLQIINDVLDMARIEAGRIAINTVAVDLYGLLDSIRQVFAPKASEKQLQLVLDIAPTVPSHILADEGKLRQILTNLIGNAIKFTEAGVINLRCAFTPGEQQTGRLFLEVEDSGKGIEPDQIERLFRPFEQLEPVAVGSGLGLAISRNFARLMDGDIHVRSARGSGSVFVLELPVALAADKRTAYDPLEVIGVAPSQTEYRLLIVEDDAESRSVLREFLQLVGFKPELAADGETALDVYQHWQPHVILLDMQLPKLDGYEVTRRIRQEYADDQTLIIAITASAFVQQRAAILASGCNDLLTKPYTHSQLFALLAKHTNIQFLYRERAPARTKDHQPPVIARELLMQLSQAQLRALYQAALTGYNPAARKLVQEIETEHPALAARLNDMVDSFWITAIADQIAPLLD